MSRRHRPLTHLRTPGEKEKKLGIKGSPTRELYFDDVRLPADRMIGEPGEGLKIALRTLDHTRVTVGAQAVGIAQGALDSRSWPGRSWAPEPGSTALAAASPRDTGPRQPNN